MASKKEIYVTIMYRWGDHECHSYLLGVYNKKHKAIEEGKKEKEWRGGKYAPEVTEVLIDGTKKRKVILESEDYFKKINSTTSIQPK